MKPHCESFAGSSRPPETMLVAKFRDIASHRIFVGGLW
jgi:hypothetical protein